LSLGYVGDHVQNILVLAGFSIFRITSISINRRAGTSFETSDVSSGGKKRVPKAKQTKTETNKSSDSIPVTGLAKIWFW
jgi:hypothetical protein